jgi:hypothetical protein
MRQMDPGDEKLFRQFYMGSIKDEERTLEEGHDVYNAVPFIKIIVPGDRNTIIDTIADNTHKRRFPKEWERFQANENQQMSGLPLREWPAITRAQAEELVFLGIFTVEQMATVADVYGNRIMNFNELKRKAETYLKAAKDSALAEKLSAENASLKAQLDAQGEELKRLSDKFEQMQRSGNVNVSTGTGTNSRK